MASHTVYNDQMLFSPRKRKTIQASDLVADVSPTGIAGFPELVSAGKPVMARPDVQIIRALELAHPDEVNMDQELQRRAVEQIKYWDHIEQDLVDGKKEFVVPSCDATAPFRAFQVNEGYVRHMVLKWELFFAPTPPSLLPSLAPCPGSVVKEMVRFFENLREHFLYGDLTEPFVVYKSLSTKIRRLMEEMEARLALQTRTVQLDSPVVYRHVDEKIRPLVEYWDAMVESSKVLRACPPKPELQLSHKNPRIMIIANLMKKKFDYDNMEKMESSTPSKPHNEIGPMVLEMVRLLEGMNYQTRTGVSMANCGNSMHMGHVHHAGSVRLVW